MLTIEEVFIMNLLFLIDVQIGLTNTRFTVTESVDSAITLCAELQVGSLERNIFVAIMTAKSNGRQQVSKVLEYSSFIKLCI